MSLTSSVKNLESRLPLDLHLPILSFSLEFLNAMTGLFPVWMIVPIQYGLLFWFIWSNRKQHVWPLFFGIGTLLNFIVISANKFRMPVRAEQFLDRIPVELMTALQNGDTYGYILADANTKLAVLGDIFLIDPFGKVFGFASIGDFFLYAGVGLLVHQLMKRALKKAG